MYPRPTEVQYAGEYRLLVVFEDGIRAELDFAPMVSRPGISSELRSPKRFAEVRLDAEAETLVWPNGADICPDVLYHLATGAALPGPLDLPPAILIRRERTNAPIV